jgi:hypothetical protein
LTLIAACDPGKNDSTDGSSTSSSTSSSTDPTESADPTDSTGATESPDPTESTGATESPDPTDSTGATDATASSTSPNTSDPDTSGTTGPDEDEFGFICVELAKAESEESDPFAGTATIYLTLEYESCLNDFYTETHPEYAGGPEGTAVLEEWVGRLCSEPVAGALVACEVDGFEQNLPDGAPAQFTVVYKALDAAQIDGRTLLWGPAPLAEFAGCEPTARAVSVLGFPDGGGPLWSAQTWENPVGLVKSEASGCIQVAVAKAP